MAQHKRGKCRVKRVKSQHIAECRDMKNAVLKTVIYFVDDVALDASCDFSFKYCFYVCSRFSDFFLCVIRSIKCDCSNECLL